MSEKCPKCGTELAYTGAPLHEDYCPNKNCTYEFDRMMAGIRDARKPVIEVAERAKADGRMEIALWAANGHQDFADEIIVRAASNLGDKPLIEGGGVEDARKSVAEFIDKMNVISRDKTLPSNILDALRELHNSVLSVPRALVKEGVVVQKDVLWALARKTGGFLCERKACEKRDEDCSCEMNYRAATAPVQEQKT